MPFEQAPLHLDDGRRLRPVGRRSEAVGQLGDGPPPLLRPGCRPLRAAVCRGARAPAGSAATESPAVTLGLSRAEMAVARLVATGLTNREVAGELYVSVKTVEYHLRNCFIKLDITSRRQLADPCSAELSNACQSRTCGPGTGPSPPGDSRATREKTRVKPRVVPWGQCAVRFPLTGTHGHLINTEADCAPASRSQPGLGQPDRGPDRPRWCRSR